MNLSRLFLPAACLAVMTGVASGQINGFKISDDFTVERIASDPQVERPMLATFDDRGRLYVCDSSGVNLHGPELLKDPPHFIRLLEDVDGDGVFEKSSVFADHMVFPQGIAWHNGSVYVSSPPNFWRMQDGKREILATGFALTGVSDDMHGGTLGPDGRIYWFAGRFPHEIKRPDGPVIHSGTSPLLLRCRPDGSELEVVSGAQGNGVGIAFTPEGEGFASGTFLAPDSMGAGLRDAIIHCVEGGNYPVRDRVLSELKRTGDLLPPLTHLGVAAAADVTLYRGTNFGTNYEGNLFSALFNMHKIVRHVLERDGATFKCRNEDFLVSTNTDFHPTDVFEDADGSLIVIDTGGWFRIGCPTSQLAKPDVKGAIYRIRRKNAPHVDDPWGKEIAWNKKSPTELTALLSDVRFAVRDHAVETLALKADGAIPALEQTLRENSSLEARRNALWTLARMESPAARAAVRIGLIDKEVSARQVAANVAGLWRDHAAMPELMKLVETNAPTVRREAATALGRLADPAAIPALLNGLRAGSDRFLEHALIFALIRIDDYAATVKALADTNSAVRHGALIAADQMDHSQLKPSEVTPFLSPADPVLQQTALWVIGHHSDWGGSMLDFFRQSLAKTDWPETERDALKQQLAGFARDFTVQKLIVEKLHDTNSPVAVRLLILEAIAQSPIEVVTPVLGDELKHCLQRNDEAIAHQAITAIRSFPPEKRPTARRVDKVIDFPRGTNAFGASRLKLHFYAQWTGNINIPKTGVYTFTLESDDGSRLFIEGKKIIENGGNHGMKAVSGEIKLTAGHHPLRIDYFQNNNDSGLEFSWKSAEIAQQIVPAEVLFHQKDPGLHAEYYDMTGLGSGFLEPKINFDQSFLEIAADPARSETLRIEALTAVGPHVTALSEKIFTIPLGVLQREKSPLPRLAAAEALSRVPLNDDQLSRLTSAFKLAGAVEMTRLLSAYEHDENPAVGHALVAALEKSPALKSLRADVLTKTLAHYPPDVQAAAEPLFKNLSGDVAQQKAKLAGLEPVLKGGDIQRGRDLFFGNKAACFACHTVQDRGGHVGPNLSKIGAIRNGHDLLEAIVFPSASFARGFEPFIVTTDDGDTYSGVVGRETADAIYLTSGARVETRLPRNRIQEIRPGAVSVMPEGLDAQLSHQDLGDLISFLLSLK